MAYQLQQPGNPRVVQDEWSQYFPYLYMPTVVEWDPSSDQPDNKVVGYIINLVRDPIDGQQRIDVVADLPLSEFQDGYRYTFLPTDYLHYRTEPFYISVVARSNLGIAYNSRDSIIPSRYQIAPSPPTPVSLNQTRPQNQAVTGLFPETDPNTCRFEFGYPPSFESIWGKIFDKFIFYVNKRTAGTEGWVNVFQKDADRPSDISQTKPWVVFTRQELLDMGIETGDGVCFGVVSKDVYGVLNLTYANTGTRTPSYYFTLAKDPAVPTVSCTIIPEQENFLKKPISQSVVNVTWNVTNNETPIIRFYISYRTKGAGDWNAWRPWIENEFGSEVRSATLLYAYTNELEGFELRFGYTIGSRPLAGYGGVPPWIIDVPVQLPPPRPGAPTISNAGQYFKPGDTLDLSLSAATEGAQTARIGLYYSRGIQDFQFYKTWDENILPGPLSVVLTPELFERSRTYVFRAVAFDEYGRASDPSIPIEIEIVRFPYNPSVSVSPRTYTDAETIFTITVNSYDDTWIDRMELYYSHLPQYGGEHTERVLITNNMTNGYRTNAGVSERFRYYTYYWVKLFNKAGESNDWDVGGGGYDNTFRNLPEPGTTPPKILANGTVYRSDPYVMIQTFVGQWQSTVRYKIDDGEEFSVMPVYYSLNTNYALIQLHDLSLGYHTITVYETQYPNQAWTSETVTSQIYYTEKPFTYTPAPGEPVMALTMRECRDYVETYRAYYGMTKTEWLEDMVDGQTLLSGYNDHIGELRREITEILEWCRRVSPPWIEIEGDDVTLDSSLILEVMQTIKDL